MKINKAVIESYGRHLLGAAISAVATISALTGISPLEFNAEEWWTVANAIWVAALPVALRYLNTKDPAYGRVAESIAKEVGKQIKSKSSSSKRVAKK